MNDQEFQQYLHPKEGTRYTLALIVTAPLAIIVAIAVVMSFFTLLIVIGGIVLVYWLFQRTAYAFLSANAIHVTETNYPRVEEMVEESRSMLALKRPVEAFIFEQGSFNAFMRRYFDRRVVLLNSELLEEGVTDDEVRWIVARFVGMLRARQMREPVGYIVSFLARVPLVSFWVHPYERATAYSGDRVALAAIGGDISVGVSAMNKLLVGRGLGYSVSPVGIMDQGAHLEHDVFSFFSRLRHPMPHTIPRYIDLIRYAEHQFPEEFSRFATENPGIGAPLPPPRATGAT